MKKTVSILLAALILLQSFSKVWVFVSFKLNQDYIAKVLCINREKPQNCCKGKCVLQKKLEADEGKDHKQSPQKSKEKQESTYCFELQSWSVEAPIETIILKSLPLTQPLFCPSAHLLSVFHPPDVPLT